MCSRIQFRIFSLIWSLMLFLSSQVLAIRPALFADHANLTLAKPIEAISVYSNCENGEMHFIIVNNLNEPSEDFVLSIVEDDIIILLKKKIKMNPYETLHYVYPDKGLKYDVNIDFNTNSNQSDLNEVFYSCTNNSNLRKYKTKYSQEIPKSLPTTHNNGPNGISTARQNDNALNFEQNKLIISNFYEVNGNLLIEIHSTQNGSANITILNFQGQAIVSRFEELCPGSNLITYPLNQKLNQSLILRVQSETLLLTKYLLLFY